MSLAMISLGDVVRLLHGSYTHWEKHKENNEDVKRLRRRLAELIELVEEHEELAERGEGGRVVEVIRQLEAVAKHSSALLEKVEKQKWLVKAALPGKAAAALQAVETEVQYALEKVKLDISLVTSNKVQDVHYGVLDLNTKVDTLLWRQQQLLDLFLAQDQPQSSSPGRVDAVASSSSPSATSLAVPRLPPLGIPDAPQLSSLAPSVSNRQRTSSTPSSPAAESYTEATPLTSQGQWERLERRRERWDEDTFDLLFRRLFTTRPASPTAATYAESESEGWSEPPSPGLRASTPAEAAAQSFLHSIDFPSRVCAFVRHYRETSLPPSLLLLHLYPPSDIYPDNPNFDILSLSETFDPHSPSDAPERGVPIWVRLPALMARVAGVETYTWTEGMPAPALPAMEQAGQRLVVGGDRWTFRRSGYELDYAIWDAELKSGGRVRVMFDQAKEYSAARRMWG